MSEIPHFFSSIEDSVFDVGARQKIPRDDMEEKVWYMARARSAKILAELGHSSIEFLVVVKTLEKKVEDWNIQLALLSSDGGELETDDCTIGTANYIKDADDPEMEMYLLKYHSGTDALELLTGEAIFAEHGRAVLVAI